MTGTLLAEPAQALGQACNCRALFEAQAPGCERLFRERLFRERLFRERLFRERLFRERLFRERPCLRRYRLCRCGQYDDVQGEACDRPLQGPPDGAGPALRRKRGTWRWWLRSNRTKTGSQEYGLGTAGAIALDGPDLLVANVAGTSVTEVSASTGALVRVLGPAALRLRRPGRGAGRRR